MDTLGFLRTSSTRGSRKPKKKIINKIEVDTSQEAIHKRALSKALSKQTTEIEKVSERKYNAILKRMRKQDSFNGVKKITRIGKIVKVDFKDSKAFFIPKSLKGQTFNKMGISNI